MGKRKSTALLVVAVLAAGQFASADWDERALFPSLRVRDGFPDTSTSPIYPVELRLVARSATPSAWVEESGVSLTAIPTDLEADPLPFAAADWIASPIDHVIELPSPPSGSTLTLSGLLTLGSMQFARSARGLRMGCCHAIPGESDLVQVIQNGTCTWHTAELAPGLGESRLSRQHPFTRSGSETILCSPAQRGILLSMVPRSPPN